VPSNDIAVQIAALDNLFKELLLSTKFVTCDLSNGYVYYRFGLCLDIVYISVAMFDLS